MSSQSKAVSFADRVQLFCVIYISVWAISPLMAVGDIFRYTAVAATIVWLSIEMYKRPATVLRPSLATGCAIFFILYSAIAGYFIDGTEDVVRNIQLFIAFLFLIFYESYRKRDIRQLRILFWITLCILPVWLTITFNAYQVTHNVSRLLIRSGEIQDELISQGVGGYGLVYSAIILVPILLYFIKTQYLRRKALIIKAIVLINLLLSVAVIIKAGYSIALFLLVFSALLVFLISKYNFMNLLRISAAFVLLFILLPMLIMPFVEQWAANSREGIMYQRKIRDVVTLFTENTTVGTVEDRTERYQRSWQIFLDHPLLGVWEFADLGKHSAILDRLARFGIIIGLIFACAVLYPPLSFLRRTKKSSFGLALAIAFVAITFSFLDNIVAGYGFMLFLFYPIALSYIDEWDTAKPPVVQKAALPQKA